MHVNAYARPASTGRTVIAIAQFRNPDAPQLPWEDVGAEMTRAIRRALFNESDFEVRIAPELESVVSQPQYLLSNPDPSVKTLDIDYVLIGQVTDFHHTAALPKDASRWGLLSRRHEAVVALEWKMVDVRRHRVVCADHTYGVAKASWKKSVDDQYEGLDVSAYLFWNTPLGRAAHQAVDNTIVRLRSLLPATQGQPVILELHAGRKVQVQGGAASGLQAGEDLYVSVPDLSGAGQAVHDADTGQPLMVRIADVKGDSATAWLLGKAPQGIELRGATLVRSRPPDPNLAARQQLVSP